jgi:hypothetical protein
MKLEKRKGGFDHKVRFLEDVQSKNSVLILGLKESDRGGYLCSLKTEEGLMTDMKTGSLIWNSDHAAILETIERSRPTLVTSTTCMKNC